MDSLRERIAAFANESANLLVQLNELDELREQIRKLSPGSPKPVKRSTSVKRRSLSPGADWR